MHEKTYFLLESMSKVLRRLLTGKATGIILILLSFIGDFAFMRWFVQTQIGDYKQDQNLVGSIRSKTYHYPSCPIVGGIGEENKVFFANSDEAKKQGYKPCEFCRPP